MRTAHSTKGNGRTGFAVVMVDSFKTQAMCLKVDGQKTWPMATESSAIYKAIDMKAIGLMTVKKDSASRLGNRAIRSMLATSQIARKTATGDTSGIKVVIMRATSRTDTSMAKAHTTSQTSKRHSLVTSATRKSRALAMKSGMTEERMLASSTKVASMEKARSHI